MVNAEYMSYLLDMDKYAIGIRYDEDVYENDMAENILDKNRKEIGLRVINLTCRTLNDVSDSERENVVI